MTFAHADPHVIAIRAVAPRTPQGCEECLRLGTPWVHLRLCLTTSRSTRPCNEPSTARSAADRSIPLTTRTAHRQFH